MNTNEVFQTTVNTVGPLIDFARVNQITFIEWRRRCSNRAYSKLYSGAQMSDYATERRNKLQTEKQFIDWYMENGPEYVAFRNAVEKARTVLDSDTTNARYVSFCVRSALAEIRPEWVLAEDDQVRAIRMLKKLFRERHDGP